MKRIHPAWCGEEGTDTETLQEYKQMDPPQRSNPGPSAFRGRRQRCFRDTKAEDPISKHREHILEQREKSSLDIFILSHQSYIQREILSKNSEVLV